MFIMRIKKGFTLAEILIVLMVIGVLATLTVPALMRGVTESQFKTAYKKAFSTISNLTVMEKLSGNLPAVGNVDNANRLFRLFESNMSVKAYVRTDVAGGALNSGTTVGSANFIAASDSNAGGVAEQKDETGAVVVQAVAGQTYNNWIVTEDNLSYLIRLGNNNTAAEQKCGTKAEILQAQGAEDITAATLDANACFVVWVDVNGLAAGPNTAYTNGQAAQGGVGNNLVAADANYSQVVDDQFPIYVGIDGATPGNQARTVTGRIAADIKG